MTIDVSRYDLVIGLEVHCELQTKTKLFCSCANHFGSEPNTNICPVCLGLPGSLPVLNRGAVEMAMRIGLALNCTVKPSIFHRKNYFYPDMPKDYQVSQYDEPINVDGFVELADHARVGIVRAHIEEDTGKSTHIGGSGRIQGASHSLVDYNRAGVPLVEIVSAPDITSPEQARAYVSELRSILIATGASDGRMEEGSLRIDANVSVKPRGATELGRRCEVKNLNSLRSLGRAIEYEMTRQIELIEGGGRVKQETRHWNEDEGATSSMRSKEEANDYRYFPEPDLVPIAPDEAWIAAVRGAMAMLPTERRSRLFGLMSSEEQTAAVSEQVVTVVDLGLDDLVVGAAAAGAPARLALARAANEAAARPERAQGLEVEAFAELVKLEAGGVLSATQAKQVLAEMLESGGGPQHVIDRLGLAGLSPEALDGVVEAVIARYPEEWARFLAGDEKVAEFLSGQVMRETKGQANGKTVAAAFAARR